MQNAQGITYLHTDHLGSTSVTVGATINTQVYYPFGAVRASTGTLPTDYTFTGQKFDASDGLMYYGARYYDAALGRFISADTIIPNLYNPQALNRYAYVYNNPVRYTDPSGHCGGVACAVLVSPVTWIAVGGYVVSQYANYQLNIAPNAAENRQALSSAIERSLDGLRQIPPGDPHDDRAQKLRERATQSSPETNFPSMNNLPPDLKRLALLIGGAVLAANAVEYWLEGKSPLFGPGDDTSRPTRTPTNPCGDAETCIREDPGQPAYAPNPDAGGNPGNTPLPQTPAPQMETPATTGSENQGDEFVPWWPDWY